MRWNAKGEWCLCRRGWIRFLGKGVWPWGRELRGPWGGQMFASPHGRAVYEQEFWRVFAAAFDAKAMKGVVEGRLKDLKGVLSRREFSELKSEAAEVCERIEHREKYLSKQLSPALSAGGEIY